ncbi:MAG: SDR family oxidoreductase [Bacteroidales bacterium]
MKILFIGGTGNISTACSRRILSQQHELHLLTRGNRTPPGLEGARFIRADINDQTTVKKLLEEPHYDVVANFIAFTPEEITRDIGLFSGKCGQYIFISSASAYQKPPTHPVITESTPLYNPFWSYSRDKIACEELLTKAYREEGFPVTIVRPSHTYETVIPAAIGSWEDFTLIDRMRRGEPVVIPGDGTSLWVMTHSIDFAKGFTGLLGNQHAIGHPVHITSDELLTWNQIYEAMAEAAGARLKAVHVSSELICEVADKMGDTWMRGNLLGDKANSVIFDNSKIKRLVPGFVATIPFREGIARTVRWFDEDPARIRIDEHNNELMDGILKFIRIQGTTTKD